ncbi:hypothetical protein SDC9_122897 [bioreactor metagenome]|uniref:Uncharacterized protein n=1 Tax=bioreactor metagenome TaxID=1076179 RepID=A0A645CGD0_9ZZZZ
MVIAAGSGHGHGVGRGLGDLDLPVVAARGLGGDVEAVVAHFGLGHVAEIGFDVEAFLADGECHAAVGHDFKRGVAAGDFGVGRGALEFGHGHAAHFEDGVAFDVEKLNVFDHQRHIGHAFGEAVVEDQPVGLAALDPVVRADGREMHLIGHVKGVDIVLVAGGKHPGIDLGGAFRGEESHQLIEIAAAEPPLLFRFDG